MLKTENIIESSMALYKIKKGRNIQYESTKHQQPPHPLPTTIKKALPTRV